MSTHRCLALAALALLGSSARAQVLLNEVFISHIGNPDNREFVEVRGPAGASLNGYMVLFVEGDVASAAGSLDFVIDLSSGTLGANGLYTAGAVAIVPAVDQIVLGTGTNPNVNLFENGTQTVYLIQATNPGAISALLDTDVRVGGSGTTTILATDPSITILDLVGLYDTLAGGTIYDNAVVFADGNFVPGGVGRCSTTPFAWNLLDFDFSPSPGYFDISPTTANPACAIIIPPGTPVCFGDSSGTPCPCANDSAVGLDSGCVNSLSLAGRLRATGTPSVSSDTLVLNGTDVPNGPGLYYQATSVAGGGISFGDGLLCGGGALIRLGVVFAASNASSYPGGMTPAAISVGGSCAPGDARTYQLWYRDGDPSYCTPSTFNLTNALDITWGS